MRADRLLSIVWLLQSRGRMTAADLAGRLEVAPRTILRDIDALGVAGVPVVVHRGRDGGFALLPGFRPVVTALTPQESQALFAGISAAAAESLGLGQAFGSAVRKVLAAVPEPSRPAAVALADRILVDPDGWLPQRELPQLAAAQDAVLRMRRARLTYTSRGAASASIRTVDPYGLVSSAGTWYLVAAHRGEPRFYRLSRMSALVVLDDAATVPTDLDLDRLWRAHRTRFLARHEACVVDLLVRPGLLTELAERGARVVATGDLRPVDGAPWPRVSATFGDLGHARGVVVDLGGDVVAIGPPALVEAVTAHARAVLGRYDLRAPAPRQGRAPDAAPPRPPHELP